MAYVMGLAVDRLWHPTDTRRVGEPHPNLGMDPHWVAFYPYKVRIQPGESVTFQVRITNHEAELRSCALCFRAAVAVVREPATVTVAAAPGVVTAVAVTARFPTTFTTHALPIFADVTWGGRTLGEIAEAIAYW